MHSGISDIDVAFSKGAKKGDANTVMDNIGNLEANGHEGIDIALAFEQIDTLISAAGVTGMREILDAFWVSTDTLLRDAAAQVHAANFAEAARTAHAIKGSAANIGANGLADAARALEDACHGATKDDALSAVNLSNAVYSATRAALEAHLDAAA